MSRLSAKKTLFFPHSHRYFVGILKLLIDSIFGLSKMWLFADFAVTIAESHYSPPNSVHIICLLCLVSVNIQQTGMNFNESNIFSLENVSAILLANLIKMRPITMNIFRHKIPKFHNRKNAMYLFPQRLQCIEGSQ